MRPEEFIQMLADAVTKQVQAATAKAPTKLYDVKRQTPQGLVGQQISLPQALTELTDTLRISIEQKRIELTMQQEANLVLKALVGELTESRKMTQKALRQRRRDEEDDDD